VRVTGDVCSIGHDVGTIGVTPRGACRQCINAYHASRRRLAGRPVRSRGPRAIVRGDRCAAGHDVRIVGRAPTGACRPCYYNAMREYGRKHHAQTLPPAGLCRRGHMLAVTGRDERGRCRICLGNQRSNICGRGHDKRTVGALRRGRCAACARLRQGRDNDRRAARAIAGVRLPYSRTAILASATVCGICLHPRAGRMVIDHVVPLARGGDDAPWNVVAAHRRCNSVKYARLIRHEQVNGVWTAVLFTPGSAIETIWDGVTATRIGGRHG
jgi:5-methylcytosine-specific restriction endonuclease McrA